MFSCNLMLMKGSLIDKKKKKKKKMRASRKAYGSNKINLKEAF